MDDLLNKIRGLIEDTEKTDYQIFEYQISNIFTLRESNINSIVKILYNGSLLDESEYELEDSQVTIVHSGMIALDKITIYFTCYKNYSNTVLTKFIMNSIIWLSILKYSTIVFDSLAGTFTPTLTTAEENLVALIASILILPNRSAIRLPNLSETYPENMSRQEKITKLVNQFKSQVGIIDLIGTEGEDE